MTPLALLVIACLQDPVPEPAPPPAESPRLVAAMETDQNDSSERIALFTDTTIVHSTVYRGRRIATTRNVTTNELEVIGRIAAEAWALEESGEIRSGVAAEGARRIVIELGTGIPRPAEPPGTIRPLVPPPPPTARQYRFDELARVPLALARLRGALEELQDRFYKEKGKVTDWDPSLVTVDTILRRRSDGVRFRVVRDDEFEKNLELEQVDGGTARVHSVRAALPKVFSDPRDDEDRAP